MKLFILALAAFLTSMANAKEKSSYFSECEAALIWTQGARPMGELQVRVLNAFEAAFNRFPDRGYLQKKLGLYYVTAANNGSLTSMLQALQKATDSKVASTFDVALREASPAAAAELSTFDSHIRQLRDEERLAEEIAEDAHAAEVYGDRRHYEHLRDVRRVLSRFGYGSEDSTMGLIAGVAAWLHDIYKDPMIAPADLSTKFEPLIVDLVRSFKKPRDPVFSPYEQQFIWIARISDVQIGVVVKLAERIANLENSLKALQSQNLLDRQRADRLEQLRRYIAEQSIFVHYHRSGRELENMWSHLDHLLAEAKVLIQ